MADPSAPEILEGAEEGVKNNSKFAFSFSPR